MGAYESQNIEIGQMFSLHYEHFYSDFQSADPGCLSSMELFNRAAELED
jgi:hypothetical protein